ncbi:MAG: elongation factor 1-beta [Methanocalculus sp. MSAO_Arc1]|uniref:elongation factor 1-beta n=1 Tax=Methanocalculus TaxID=71151 RepID=UPI000FEFCC0A|nr:MULTISPECIES: elongation factor 1-beta [unclassified Methanocalculus]MCP1662913.1 elongation factor 1-beta [Methanocalculus sp. AMF5]RQD80379.1 MAG: elongation factor 1-beta [Methanocalculus sp. MSAO_Arc1]
MGAVAVILKVMPESPDVDLEALKAAIREKIPGISDIRDEPIGFGLVALKVATVIEDEEGATETIEAKFLEVPGIDRAEIVDLSRMI